MQRYRKHLSGVMQLLRSGIACGSNGLSGRNANTIEAAPGKMPRTGSPTEPPFAGRLVNRAVIARRHTRGTTNDQ